MEADKNHSNSWENVEDISLNNWSPWGKTSSDHSVVHGIKAEMQSLQHAAHYNLAPNTTAMFKLFLSIWNNILKCFHAFKCMESQLLQNL